MFFFKIKLRWHFPRFPFKGKDLNHRISFFDEKLLITLDKNERKINGIDISVRVHHPVDKEKTVFSEPVHWLGEQATVSRRGWDEPFINKLTGVLSSFIMPFFWLEFLSYAAAITQGSFLIWAIKKKRLRIEIRNTLRVIGIVAILLFVGAWIEEIFIQLWLYIIIFIIFNDQSLILLINSGIYFLTNINISSLPIRVIRPSE